MINLIMCWNSRRRSPSQIYYLYYKFLNNNVLKMNSNSFAYWHICIRRAHPSHLRTIFFSISWVFLIGKVGTLLKVLCSLPSPGESWIRPRRRVQYIWQNMKEFINVSMTTVSFYFYSDVCVTTCLCIKMCFSWCCFNNGKF